MTSVVSIVNMALAKMASRSTIASRDEYTPEALNASLFYAETRDEVLGMAYWNFARKTQSLALFKAAPGTPENTTSATDSLWSTAWPPPGWFYEYLYPTDCVAARYIIPQWNGSIGVNPPLTSAPVISTPWPWPQQDAARFVVAADVSTAGSQIKVILTNAQVALLNYTQRVTEVTVYDANFVNAVSAALAAKMVVNGTGNLELAQGLFKAANVAIEQARKVDGNEGTQIQEIPTDWIAIRGITFSSMGQYNSPYMMPYGPLYPIY